MVGVPGRSRACQPCKKRRVACDLQQPECQRCLKAKRKCEYEQSRIFVLNDEGTHKTVYRKKDGASTFQPDRERMQNGISHSDAISEDSIGLPDEMTEALLLYRRPGDAALNRQALLAHALENDKAYHDPTLASLTSSVNAGMMDTCLRYPFLACYTVWLGRKKQDARLVDASREFYVHALKDTHIALATPETAYTDAALAACNGLGIYEAVECPGGTMNAYYWHRAASYRLVQLRGPAAHQDGAAHQVFTNFRFFGILHAFDNGHATFLSSPEWTTIPFSIHPKRKFDELIDIFALGPETASLGKSIPTLPKDQVIPTALQILGKLSIIKQKLQAFYLDLENSVAKPLFWERVCPVGAVGAAAADFEFTFPPALWFDNLDMASTLTLYWTIQAMVWSGLADLHSLFDEHGIAHLFVAVMGESSEYTPQSMQLMWMDRARKVLQSIAFFTTSAALEAGPPRATTQLAIVIDVMKNRKGCEAEYRWAAKARKRIGARWLRIHSTFDKE